MSSSNFASSVYAGCGILMIIGAIVFLRGAIVHLNEAINGKDFKIDVIKQVRMTSTYPAIGLFGVGLVLLASACGSPWAMNPHSFSIYVCVASGFVLVLGCLLLLTFGRIQLNDANKGDALSMELLKKIKITTTYPAIAIFVLGLAFCGVGIWFSQGDTTITPSPPAPAELDIVAKITGVEDPNIVSVTLQPDNYHGDTFAADSGGLVDHPVPEVKQYIVTVTANGYAPAPFRKPVYVHDAKTDANRRLLDLQEIKFTKITSASATVDHPPQTGSITPTPSGLTLEPFRAAARKNQ